MVRVRHVNPVDCEVVRVRVRLGLSLGDYYVHAVDCEVDRVRVRLGL